MTILDTIAERARLRVARDKEKISTAEIERQALSLPRENFSNVAPDLLKRFIEVSQS